MTKRTFTLIRKILRNYWQLKKLNKRVAKLEMNMDMLMKIGVIKR